jgi:hypothetical protein
LVLYGDLSVGGLSGDMIRLFIDNPPEIPLISFMARISRIVVPEYPHHITQRGIRSMAVLES